MVSLKVGPSLRTEFPHAELAVSLGRAVWRKAGMKVLFQLQVQYFSKIKFSCCLRSMGALYVESKCIYIGMGEYSQTAEISLIAGWSWIRYYQIFNLIACTSSLSFILTTVSPLEYSILLLWTGDLASTQKWQLCNPEVCFWGINFMCVGEIKPKCNEEWVWEGRTIFIKNQIIGNLFVFGFKYTLRKRKSLYPGVLVTVV